MILVPTNVNYNNHDYCCWSYFAGTKVAEQLLTDDNLSEICIIIEES